MWLDYLEVRLNSARSLFSNLSSALIGLLFGGIGVWVGTIVTGNTWGGLGGIILVILVAVVLGRSILGDSDHRALEQRWLLYREQERQVDVQ